MRRLADALYGMAVALWVGGLWAIGYLAVPVLFAQLADRMLAGRLAGFMFAGIAWAGFACGAYLLACLFSWHGREVFRSWSFRLILLMLVLAAVGHFGLQPQMEALKAQAWPQAVMTTELGRRFGALHGIASIVYLIQSLAGLGLAAMPAPGRR